MTYDPELVRQLQTSARWSAAARTGLDGDAAGIVGSWDGGLLRESRVLVPVDVQALVVSPSGEVDAVAMPGPLTPGVADPVAAVDAPEPFAPESARAPGVHLHWAVPDALLRGGLADPRGEPGGGLGLPPLPDHWVVVRLLAPAGGAPDAPVHVRGWLVEADTSTVRDLAAGPAGAPLPGTGTGRALPAAELTGAAAPLTWTASYDAAFARLAWHDPLEDLAADPELGGALPGGPAAGAASYLVAGWWSVVDLDPLDGVRTDGGLTERLAGLGWRIVEGGGWEDVDAAGPLERAAALGVPVATRFGPRPTSSAGPSLAGAGAGAAGAAGLGSSGPDAVSGGAGAFVLEGGGVIGGEEIAIEASTLLHGAVVGVPVDGREPAVDLRPDPATVRLALGEHTDDLVAAMLSGAAEPGSAEERRAVERLLSAFADGLLGALGTPEGVVDVDEHEHARGFAAQDSGEPPVVDRVLVRGDQVPPRPPRPAVAAGLRFVPAEAAAGRPAFGLLTEEPAATTVSRAGALRGAFPATVIGGRAVTSVEPAPGGEDGAAAEPLNPGARPPDERLVEHPAPPRHFPIDPVLAVSGAGRSLRHGGDGRGSPDGMLRCRRGSQVVQQYAGVLAGADLLPSLASGAVPEETAALAREALLLSPHLARWLAGRAAGGAAGLDLDAATARISAELALRYDATGAYTGRGGPKAIGGAGTPTSGGLSPLGDRDAVAAAANEALRRHSLLDGVEPDLVGITAWAQPWVPIWVEYELAVDVAGDLAGWTLGAVDLEPGGVPEPAATRTVAGRVPLTTAPGDALGGAIARWLVEETTRDADRVGEADQATEERLAALGSAAEALDLVGAALAGVRDSLLGLPASALRPRDGDAEPRPPAPLRLPDLLVAGSMALARARLVDAFGRTLDLNTEAVAVPARLEVAGARARMQRTPRFTAPARARLRPVGAAAARADDAVDARVDEVEPARQVSPVSGFLLPDHLDESIEVFGADGAALGELLVEPVGGGVVWEAAPGRPLPADAPPGAGLDDGARPLGWLAAGLIGADAAARGGLPASADGAPPESALSALLRAIDTTLWSCDPLAAAGSAALCAIAGHPVAVVRAVLSLDVADDLDALDLDADSRAARAAAYRALAAVEVPVRLGEITRTDDGLLGYYLDDDYSSVRAVDPAVRELAREAGPLRGHLAPWGTTPEVPAEDEIRHPYLSTDDVVSLRPGVPRMVTMLLLPGLSVHLTSGVTPRERVSLARAWFGPALDRLIPSVRVGPVLIDPGEVRLPPVAALGERQLLTYRQGPLSWRDDPILAATQSALVPDDPTVLREGWIRIDPAGGSGAAQ